MAVGTALAIGAGVSALAGGVGNYLANKSAGERAALLQDKSLQEWIKLQIPDPEAQKVAMQKLVSQGTLDPKLEHAISADPSAFEKVSASATNQAAQNRALGELESIGNSGGLRLQDKAGLQEAMMDAQVKDRAQRQGIAAEMQRRGAGGSGFEVAGQLQGQQGTADRMASNSLKTAGMAQDRALQAIMGSGDLATKYRTQDFNEQAQKASAADKINMFNTNNLQDVQQRNVMGQNRAQEMNLANQQRISDQNVGLSNQEQMYNKGLIQKQFDNQAAKTAGMTGQYANQAANEVKQGANEGNLYSNLGGGISSALTAGAQYDALDKYMRNKKVLPNGTI